MQFVCLVHIDDEAFAGFTKADHERFDRENLEYDRALARQGKYVTSAALAPVNDAVTVRKRNGKLSATDGPYPETKEHLGGFIIIEARDLAEAVELVSADPMAAMGSLEIRPMMNIGSPEWPAWAEEKFGRR